MDRLSMFITGCLVLFIVSCNNKKAQKSGSFNVSSLTKLQKQNLKNFELSDYPTKEVLIDDFDKNLTTNIITDVEYIKLETIPESLIGEISKIIVRDDKIFILDDLIAKNLFIFSIDGKFLNKIKGFGEGPKEITQPYDFFINSRKKEIAVFDGIRHKIVFYDYNLIPKYEKKTFFRFKNMRLLSDNTLFVSVNGSDNSHITEINNNGIILLDSVSNPILKGFELPPNENNFTLVDHLHQYQDNSVVWVPKFTNSIFQYKQNQNGIIDKRYTLNFKSKEIPEEYYSKEFDELFRFAKDKNLYYYNGDYEENQNSVYFKIMTPLRRNQIIVFLDKATQKYSFGKLELTTFDLPLLGEPKCSYNDEFVSFIQSDALKSLKLIANSENKIPVKLKELIIQSHEADNPIIQTYKISIKNDNGFKTL
jgi:hypothetical protein